MAEQADPHERAQQFRRNDRLESLLRLLEDPLLAAERTLLDGPEPESRPLVLIVGCARAGSTLLLQLLANSGQFGYPSNFLSRFSAAPVLGAHLQRMLFDADLQFRDELALAFDPVESYSSDLGKTAGVLAPNEFGYFWRRWLDGDRRGDSDLVITDDSAEHVDFSGLRRELAALADVFGRPFVLKAQFLNWVLRTALDQMSDAFVLFIRRDPFYTAQSLLEARMSFFGSFDAWYSLKPPEYTSLRRLPPTGQVAGQVIITEEAIERELKNVDSSRQLTVRYEQLTQDPQGIWKGVASMIGRHPGCPELGLVRPVEAFQSANTPRLDDDMLEDLTRWLERHRGERG